MEERTGWRGQSESQIGKRRNGRPVGAAETSKERAERRRLQRKNLSTPCVLKRKESSVSQEKHAGAAFAKRKRNRAVCPEYQIMREERVKVGESPTYAPRT